MSKDKQSGVGLHHTTKTAKIKRCYYFNEHYGDVLLK